MALIETLLNKAARVKQSPSLTSIDLFAGAGGLTEGLRQAGFRSLYANEVIPTYAETFAINHASTIVEHADIRELDPARIRRTLDLRPGELSLIAGGPPCQGFSINAPKRSAEDLRNHLFRDFLRFVEEFMPRAVLIENVPGLVSFDNGGTLEAILEALSELGYVADVQILYAPHFGVPQTRWRTIIIGVREGLEPLDAFPTPVYRAPRKVNFTSSFLGRSIIQSGPASDAPKCANVSDALADLPQLLNGESGTPLKNYRTPVINSYQAYLRQDSDQVAQHEAGRLGKRNLERLRYISPGGNWTDIPYELLPTGMRRARKSDHTKRYGRVAADGLASTILTKCDPHWGAYFHYNQDRTFTVREAARLQSFPDNYVFTGNKAQQYEQVGNAVPPLLGKAVGAALAKCLADADANSAELLKVGS